MALTLAEAKVGYTDKIDQQVIDEFRRDSVLLDKLTFDDTISPTGGSNLVYGYQRLETPSTAGIRQINQEYTPNEAKRTKQTASPVILGGSFEIDRVIAQTSGAINELDFQIKQKTLAGANYFHNLVINGTSAASGTGYIPNTFDGLKKILAGKSTEASTDVDISTTAAMNSNYNALLDELDAFIALLAAKPDILMMNTKMLTKIRAAARRAGYYDRTKNDFGNYVETYNGIALLDAGQYYDGTKTVDVVDTTAPTESAYGTTSIYAASIDKEVLKTMLSRDVNNEPLLHLTFFLIDMSEQGLVIGSYLNKNLASYYLSVAYHYVTEQCYKERRGKRKRLLSHALWYADDCILIGKDLRDLKMCQRKYEKFLKEKLHVEVKPNTKVIDLKTGYIDIVGFKISRKNATMRASNFRRMRKNLKRINQYTADNIPLHEARAFNSRTGSFKHLDMLQYIKDNNITELLDSCNNTIRAKTERRTICEKWYSIQNRTALK